MMKKLLSVFLKHAFYILIFLSCFVQGRPNIGTVASSNVGKLYTNDLVFHAVGRSGLTMLDALGTDTVKIYTPTYIVNGNYCTGLKTRSAEKLFDGNSYTIYLKDRKSVV